MALDPTYPLDSRDSPTITRRATRPTAASLLLELVLPSLLLLCCASYGIGLHLYRTPVAACQAQVDTHAGEHAVRYQTTIKVMEFALNANTRLGAADAAAELRAQLDALRRCGSR